MAKRQDGQRPAVDVQYPPEVLADALLSVDKSRAYAAANTVVFERLWAPSSNGQTGNLAIEGDRERRQPKKYFRPECDGLSDCAADFRAERKKTPSVKKQPFIRAWYETNRPEVALSTLLRAASDNSHLFKSRDKTATGNQHP